MGPLFVIVGWLLIAILFGTVAASLVWVGQHRQPPQIRRRRAAVTAGLPLLLMSWFLPAALLWSGWGALTGLHAPFQFGDSRTVALPNDHELVFIDDFTRGSIYPRDGGEARVSDITIIGVDAALVFGFTERGRFVFDTSGRGATRDFESLQSLVPLRPVDEFPGRPRNPFDGWVWCVLWLLPPFLLARRWWTPRALIIRVD
jgi:hypothetical protein